MPNTIFVLNGPNLNRLGTREPALYGVGTLNDIENCTRAAAERAGYPLEFRQTNSEGVLVGWVHEAADHPAGGVIINAAGYTHTSVALHDALRLLDVPVIELHLSNTLAREAFRHTSYVSGVATAVIMGCGPHGYVLAIQALANMLSSAAAA